MRSRTMRILSLSLFLGALAGCAGMTETRQTVETPLQRAMAARTQAVEHARVSFRAEKAVAELLAERKSAASRAPRLHSGPDIPIGPGESCSRLGG